MRFGSVICSVDRLTFYSVGGCLNQCSAVLCISNKSQVSIGSFKCFRIIQPLVSVLPGKFRPKNHLIGCGNFPKKKTLKNRRFSERTDRSLAGSFIDIFSFLSITVIYQNLVLWIFENRWVSGYIYLITCEYLFLILRTTRPLI